MGVGTTNVTITTTETGWILSKEVDGKKVTMNVTDKNKNGQIDSSDACETKNGNFSAAEIAQARKSIFEQGKKETTVGDYLKEQATIEQEEQRAEAFEQRQRAQRRRELEYRNAQLDRTQKKKSFWGTVGNIGTAVLGGLGAIAGFGFGFGSNSWQYNGGSWNDFGVRMFASGTQGLEGLSTFMNGQYSQYGNANSWMNTGNGEQSYMPNGSSFAELAQMQADYMNQQKEQHQQYMESLNEATAKQKANQEAQETAKAAKELYEQSTKEGAAISPSNKAKINEIYQPSKKAEDYTAEEKAIIDTIAQYPEIPYEAIDKDDTLDNGKLTKKLAEDINELVSDYNVAKDDKKEEILSKENYTTLKGILEKAKNGKLTEQDIASINTILKDPIKKQS